MSVFLRWVLIGILRFYQLCFSPIMPARCCFHPTCSEYAITALFTYPVFPALVLIIKRIVRCHPFSQGGIDPVPDIKCLDHNQCSHNPREIANQ